MTATRDALQSPSSDASRSFLLRLLSSAHARPPAGTPAFNAIAPDHQLHPFDPFDCGPRVVQLIPLASIDLTDAQPDVPGAFVQSIAQHGVLEPVLLRAGHDRPRVLNGRRRIAAAIRAGLHVVPAIVITISDEEARAIAAGDARSAPAMTDAPLQDAMLQELARTVTLLSTCVHLADAATGVPARVGFELMDAEIWRATALLTALRNVERELQPQRTVTTAGAIIERVLEETSLMRRLLGLADVMRPSADDEQHAIRVDPSLTVTALSGLVAILCAWAQSSVHVQMAISATVRNASVCFTLEQHGIDVPASWLDQTLAASVSDRRGGVGVTLWLLQARRIALAHGGDTALHQITGGSSMTLTLTA